MIWKNRLAKFWPGGAAPEHIAMSIAWAVLLGVFPMWGLPTLMCVGAALLLRLNHPAMQAVNLLTAPLQLALLVPFSHLGAHMLHLPNQSTLHGGASVAQRVGGFLVHAVAGWFCVALPVAILLFLAIRPLRARLAMRYRERTRLESA